MADWFGIDALLCSPDCVDVYNPKVIQASMGSIFHVPVFYLDLHSTLKEMDMPLYAAMLQGTPIYEVVPVTSGILLIGNEANGISQELIDLCNEEITIPPRGKAESLNAAMASGILTAFLFR